MLLRMSPNATRPLHFGKNRKSRYQGWSIMPTRPFALSDDLRLFALTFAAGFISVSILIA